MVRNEDRRLAATSHELVAALARPTMLALALACLLQPGPVRGQRGGHVSRLPRPPINPVEVTVPMVLDSGSLDNPALQSQLVFSELIHLPEAGWLRAYFSDVTLPPGSVLRLTSMEDGETQELDRFTAQMWGNGSAYFNGDSLLLELVAAPETVGNRVTLDHVGTQPVPPPPPEPLSCTNGPCGACGSPPLSNEDWSLRWLNGGCTASVYNAHGCFVSAGHCVTNPGTVLAVRVPSSDPDCTMRQPGVADQFPVLATDGFHVDCDVDWRVGRLGVNAVGQTHHERYGVFKPLATAPPSVGDDVDIYHFGSSAFPVDNGVQRHTDCHVSVVSSGSFEYNGCTITGGASGSGILIDDEIAGVNTCCSGPCSATGCRIDRADFTAARQQMCSLTVRAAWESPFCLNDTTITAPVTVCNLTSSNESYTLTFTGLAPSPLCSVPGPTMFTPSGWSNPIGPIPPGGCLTVDVIIGRPTHLTAALLTSCYQVTATSGGGFSATDSGSVVDRRDICTMIIGGGPTDVVSVAVGQPHELTFSVRNDEVSSGEIPYRVEAFSPDMKPSGAVALDGLPYGVATSGELSIPRGETGQLTVDVRYRWLQPFDISDLVISTDVDRDGAFEPLASAGLRSIGCARTPCGVANERTLLCHAPTGSKSPPRTICVSDDEVSVHLSHGDTCGPCEAGAQASSSR